MYTAANLWMATVLALCAMGGIFTMQEGIATSNSKYVWGGLFLMAHLVVASGYFLFRALGL
jgi:uncharacterized membrane protein YhhN